MPGGDFIDDFALNDVLERTDASAAMSCLGGVRYGAIALSSESAISATRDIFDPFAPSWYRRTLENVGLLI